MTYELAPDEAASVRRLFASPPSWPLHLTGTVVGLVALWSASYPGVGFDSFLMSSAGLLLLTGCWFVRLVVHIGLKGERRRNFLIAPACGLVLVALLVSGAPLKVRWHFSEDDFNRVLPALSVTQASNNPDSAQDGWERVAVPRKIGSYSITAAYRVPGGVIFYESGGSFFDDAGFGWFPNGPDAAALDNGSFERPEFTPLGGPWYSWTASW